MTNEDKHGGRNNVLAVLIFAILIAGCVSPQPPAQPPALQPPTPVMECKAKDCFITAANDCKELTVELAEEIGIIKYSSKNCTLTKTIVSLNPAESADIKKLLEGKSLTCKYEKGKFDSGWVNSLVTGLEACEGELRDIIGQLIIFS